jgi:16S rRNA C1402 N4-methylase RsmH
MDKDYGHKPALLAECMEALDIRPGGTYLDGTLGRAGHALELLRRRQYGQSMGGVSQVVEATCMKFTKAPPKPAPRPAETSLQRPMAPAVAALVKKP